MRDKLKYDIWLLFFSIIIISCEDKKLENWNNPYLPFEHTIELKKVGEKAFPLDSVTSIKYGSVQSIGSKDKKIIVFFNSYDNSFLLYNHLESSLLKKISFEQEGPNGIGKYTPFTNSFGIINLDSIVVYNQSLSKLFLVDTTGKVKNSYSLISPNKEFDIPRVTLGEPLYIHQSEVYIPAYPGYKDMYDPNSQLKDNLLIILNLNTGKIRINLKYPPLYQQASWGEQLQTFSSTFNPVKEYFVYSFPIDHYIYVSDHKNMSPERHYAGSKEFKHVQPLSFSSKRFVPATEDDEIKNLITQHRYGTILYDKHFNLYYRLVSNAIPEKDLKVIGQSGYELPNGSFIILDENLKKIGEQDFDFNQYSIESSFITDEGLYLRRRDTGEDEMRYDVFHPVKKINN